MAHAFKNRSGTYKGQTVTILRAANPGDLPAGTKLDAPHFLVASEAGDKLVVPVGAVKIAEAKD